MVSGGYSRVVEVIGRVVSHAEAPHDSHRADIGRDGERDDFTQISPIEPVGNRRACRLRRESAAPILPCKPPADLDRRGEMRREVVKRKADIADEPGLIGYLHRPKPVAARVESRLDAISKGIRHSAVERAREVLHHDRVGIEARKWLPVAWKPLPQQEPFGA